MKFRFHLNYTLKAQNILFIRCAVRKISWKECESEEKCDHRNVFRIILWKTINPIFFPSIPYFLSFAQSEIKRIPMFNLNNKNFDGNRIRWSGNGMAVVESKEMKSETYSLESCSRSLASYLMLSGTLNMEIL